MKSKVLFLSLSVLFLSSCIKDDFIDDMIDSEITIITAIDTIGIDSEFQFQSRYLNNIGQEEKVIAEWSSSDEEVIAIDSNGLAKGLSIGSSIIKVTYEEEDTLLQDSLLVQVGAETVIVEQTVNSTIMTTSSYLLEGTMEIREIDQGIELNILDDYKASTALPGFYLYLSNNRNSIANALEVSKITVFSGAHSYTVPNVAVGDYNFLVYYCKPFNIKVGEAVLN